MGFVECHVFSIAACSQWLRITRILTNSRHAAVYSFPLFLLRKIIEAASLLTRLAYSLRRDINELPIPLGGRTWRWRKTTRARVKRKRLQKQQQHAHTIQHASRLLVLAAFLYRQTILIPVGTTWCLKPQSRQQPRWTLRDMSQISSIKWWSAEELRILSIILYVDAYKCVLSPEKHFNARFAETECI